jgi:hypothetical protein
VSSTSERLAAARVRDAAPPRRTEWFPMRALSHVLVLAFAVVAAIYAFVWLRAGGNAYYGVPLAVRGYAPPHRWLRPAGRYGILFGIAGLALMLVTLLYVLRKKVKALARIGNLKIWLEAHIFCGIVGPALITLHTSFKFNGIISVAYWSMVVVVLSGFVGRYLYVRIPKTIRGAELSVGELEARAGEIRSQLAAEGLPAASLAAVEALDAPVANLGLGAFLGSFFFGELRAAWRFRRLGRRLRGAGIAPPLVRQTVALAAERAALQRRIAFLGRTRKLFELWHVLHKPLVYVMLAIAALHVFVAVYFGYSPGGRR